ncbi:MAG: HEPN domain-containing protein [Chloroflexi bacterium]|nr:HEPN domain-containing protein [Chloroflexota bacterium]
MNVAEVVQYWMQAAEDDWPVINHLFDSGDYHYALFFGHLYIEKMLKALVVQQTRKHAPRTHNLLMLAERAGLDLSDERRIQLLRLTGYNLETRYPEDRASLRNRFTKRYTKDEIKIIQEIGEWIKAELKHGK